jgi:hypothetical protein
MNLRQKQLVESVSVGGIAFLAYLAGGYYLSQVLHYLPHDGLARMVSAFLVLNGTEVKLATIGFVWPPLPTLVLIPFAAVRYLVDSWLALVICSALFMGISAMLLNRLCAKFEMPLVFRLLFSLIYVTNPMTIVFGANGMSEAVLSAFLLASVYWLVRYWQSGRHLHMIMAAFFLGMLPLIRYEMLLFTAASGVLVIIQTYAARHAKDKIPFRDLLEGNLLAYGAMVVYPVFLWMVANWEIMGSPLYFLRNDRSAISVSGKEITGAGLDTNFVPAMEWCFRAWIELFPLVFVACILALVIGVWKRSPFLFAMGGIALITPVFLGYSLYRGSVIPLLRYFIVEVPLGIVVALIAWRVLYPNLQKKRASYIFLGGLAAVGLLSNISTVNLFSTYKVVSVEMLSWVGFTQPDKLDRSGFMQFEDGYTIGKFLPNIIPPGKRILMDTYAGGYAVILASGNNKMFLDYTDPDFEAAAREPWKYADYVLVPSVYTEGDLNYINLKQRTLYTLGATWAEPVKGLPETSYGWKLFKIIK